MLMRELVLYQEQDHCHLEHVVESVRLSYKFIQRQYLRWFNKVFQTLTCFSQLNQTTELLT